MGSTSYDEARDASDPRWAGASWYGPTTGEYWIVNPREYADPRKHGPGYSSRVRSGPTIAVPDTASADEPDESTAAPRDERPPEGTAARPRAASVGAAGSRPAGAAASPAAGHASGPSVDAILRPGTSDPLRRLGLVLLAWAPIAIAAAGIIGDATGCATYSTACDGTDPFLPWVAQAVILGLLLLIPALARVLAAGAVAIVLGLVPATALVIAFGGARSTAAGAVLGGALALAWLAGVGWGTWRLLRREITPASGGS
jgi:hypothetical protein